MSLYFVVLGGGETLTVWVAPWGEVERWEKERGIHEKNTNSG